LNLKLRQVDLQSGDNSHSLFPMLTVTRLHQRKITSQIAYSFDVNTFVVLHPLQSTKFRLNNVGNSRLQNDPKIRLGIQIIAVFSRIPRC
jgi:hypothetical protein